MTGAVEGPVRTVLAYGSAQLPELTPGRVLTTWVIEPLPLLLLLAAAAVYLFAVRRLRAQGVSWSSGRVVLWLLGLALSFLATSSVVGAYDGTLFSANAVQHLLLQMLAPVPLAMAAPITLAVRTLPPRQRALLLAALHSAPARLISQPLVAFAVFVISPFVLYYSPLYELTLRSDLAHNLSHAHLLGSGFLLFAVLLGLDPLPTRVPYVFRFLMIVALGPMHVLLGVPIMMGTSVLAADYYEQVGRTWGPSILSDQQFGGGLLWVFGDVVTIAFLAGMYGQWLASDRREARRVDRHLDRLYGDGPTMPVPWADRADPVQAGRLPTAAGGQGRPQP